MADRPAPRRRSGLQQERSRQTRQRLVRTALELWTERGFETGVEETTVEEIVKAAGVTKGTFYFHFAHKLEILLEMGWETANVVHEEALRCVKAGRTLEESLMRLIAVLTARTRAAPPAAVARAVCEFRRQPWPEPIVEDRMSLALAFEAVFAHAQEVGDLSDAIVASEMARILQAVVMDAIVEWATSSSDLLETLRRRTLILIAGLQHPIALVER
jgi:AcrR family transcriptional regulator